MTKEEKKATENLNLYQKLVEIRKSVEYLKKESTGHRYNYTKESQVITALRPKMDEQNVFLEVGMLEPQWHEDGTTRLVSIGFEFIWVNADNPEEKITKYLYLQDAAGDPKKIGGLSTYALRYHLCKFFQIATDDLDLDAFQTEVMSAKTTSQPRITEEQVAELEEKINGHFQISRRLLERYKSLENIPVSDYDVVIETIEKLIEDSKG